MTIKKLPPLIKIKNQGTQIQETKDEEWQDNDSYYAWVY